MSYRIIPAFFPLVRPVSALLAAAALTLAATVACAAPEAQAEAVHAPAAPASVRLSPSGGFLEVAQQAAVTTRDHVSEIRLVLPGGAANLQVSVPGHSIARMVSAPQTLDQSGGLTALRTEKLKESMTLTGRITAIKAQLALWQGKNESKVYTDVVQIEKQMGESVPVLVCEQADLERRLALVQQELKQLGASPAVGQSVTLTLQKPVSAPRLPVTYSYTLRECGWRPVYTFDAQPDRGKGDETDVRLMAEVWQFSGMDWTNAKLTLVSGSEGPREPAALRRWTVEAGGGLAQRRAPVAFAAAPMARAPKTRADAAAEEADGEQEALATADTSSAYATWTLAARGLPEGRSRLLMVEDVWKALPQWLARPAGDDNRVWLMGRYTLPPQQAWPDGPAEFCVGGQSVGKGAFSPKGGEVTLYFGADPRLRVTAKADKRQRGESGIINKNRNWSWAWTYELTNTRDRAVTVRLERPMPMLVDQGVSVTYNDKPEAQQNPDEHMLFWNVEVPAGGKAEVRHALTISSPKEMDIYPEAP